MVGGAGLKGFSLVALWGSLPTRVGAERIIMDVAAWSTVESINQCKSSRKAMDAGCQAFKHEVLSIAPCDDNGAGGSRPQRRLFRIDLQMGGVRKYGCFESIFTWLLLASVLERDARFGKCTCDMRSHHLSSLNVESWMIISASTCNGRWRQFCLCTGFPPSPEPCPFLQEC